MKPKLSESDGFLYQSQCFATWRATKGQEERLGLQIYIYFFNYKNSWDYLYVNAI